MAGTLVPFVGVVVDTAGAAVVVIAEVVVVVTFPFVVVVEFVEPEEPHADNPPAAAIPTAKAKTIFRTMNVPFSARYAISTNTTPPQPQNSGGSEA